jgi:hypothetical protein
MFFLRNAITIETQNGLAAMREHQGLHPWESLLKNLQSLNALRNTKGLLWLIGFYVMTFFIEQMNLFQILYFSQTLHFGALAVSLEPVSVAVITAIMYGFVLRRLSSFPVERTLVLTCALGLIGAILVVLIPAGNLAILLLVISVLAGATFLTKTSRDTVLFSHLPSSGTADLFSAVQVLTMLFSIPASVIAGAIFSVHPVMLFVLIAILNLALLVMAWVISRLETRATVTN